MQRSFYSPIWDNKTGARTEMRRTDSTVELALTTAANFGGHSVKFYWLLIIPALDGRLAV
jgi:hypothetical protein